MTQPLFRILQMLVRCVLALLWLAVTVAATSMLFFGNFLVAWQAFTLLNFEPEPLAQVPLIGPIATVLAFGDAPIAATYAAVLTVAMAVAVITACKLVSDAVTLFFDMRQAKLAGDLDPAARIKWYETLVGAAVAVFLAVLLVRWDVALFALRLDGLMLGADHIDGNVKWSPDAGGRLGQYLASFASAARWGYIAVIAGVAFATEKAFQRASERWLVFGQTIDAAISGPIAPHAAAQVDPPAPAMPLPLPASGIVAPPAAAVRHAIPAVAQTVGQFPRDSQPVPPPPGQTPATPQTAAAPTRRVVAVIYGPGERRHLPLDEVERSAEFVRDGSGRAWFLKTYYDELHATPVGVTNTEAAEKEDRRNA